MGIKRRAMFNPKFRYSRPERWEMGQNKKNITTPSNSEMIELVNEQRPQEINNSTDIVEDMIKEVEELLVEVNNPVYKTSDLKKKKKTELLEIAKSLNCEVTNKNTKAQMIAAIEKQSS